MMRKEHGLTGTGIATKKKGKPADYSGESSSSSLENSTRKFASIAGSRMMQEVKDLLDENLEMKEIITEMKKEIDYGKQRENKLMFFLFLLKERGYPITEIFEQEIKDIPTMRFSKEFDESYKVVFYEYDKKR
jgi:hypothetical protein